MKFPYAKHALKAIFQSPLTDKYPHVKAQVPKNYRGKIKFNPELCVNCGLCMKVCSPSSITKTVKQIDGGQEITMRFDLGSCTFCSLCSDFCGKKAIELTEEYSMVTTDKSTLFVEGTFVKKLPPKPPVKEIKTEEKPAKKPD